MSAFPLTATFPLHHSYVPATCPLVTQDFLTCAFLVTAKDTFFTRAEMCLLTSYMSDACDPVDL
eukprot:scaffold119254_cov17-Tisochrysis_lutea.AAC.1